MASDTVTFGISSKGQPTVIDRNFEYVKVRDNLNGRTYWRCKKYQSFKCKARLITDGDRFVSDRNQEHTHGGNVATSLARKAVGDMKVKMAEISATPSTVVASVSQGLPDHVLMALPKRPSLNRVLQLHRTRLLASNGSGSVLPPPPSDINFDVPPVFADMILYDTGVGADRLILMGCPELLDGLARAKLWLADGTFKVVPLLFFQLYTIHFELVPGTIPVGLYCLVQNKQRAVYDRILSQLKNLIPMANPDRILVDFEIAAMNAFRDAFPNAVVAGCYFHLTQSVTRKVQEIGMKAEYESDDEIRGYVRCLSALAFVPVEDVGEAFDLLASEMPQHDKMPDLLSYFKHTYVRGLRRPGRGQNHGPALFPVNTWNHHFAAAEGIARTTNAVEGWHYGLQALFQCHHPTMWTFLNGLSKDRQRQKTIFLQSIAGVQLQPQKKYRDLKQRVANAVQLYSASEVIRFLQAMAHLSHQ